jgi:hypothetical protein
MQHVIATHTLITGKYVTRYVPLKVANMKPMSGRIREHVQNVVFRFITLRRNSKRASILPDSLPFGFDCVWIVRNSYLLLPHAIVSYHLSKCCQQRTAIQSGSKPPLARPADRVAFAQASLRGDCTGKDAASETLTSIAKRPSAFRAGFH